MSGGERAMARTGRGRVRSALASHRQGAARGRDELRILTLASVWYESVSSYTRDSFSPFPPAQLILVFLHPQNLKNEGMVHCS